MELRNKSDVLAGAFRCYTMILQGTWFLQLGTIYPHGETEWDFEDHEQVMLATVIFVIHVILDAAFIIVLSIGIDRYQRSKCCSSRFNNIAYEQVKCFLLNSCARFARWRHSESLTVLQVEKAPFADDSTREKRSTKTEDGVA